MHTSHTASNTSNNTIDNTNSENNNNSTHKEYGEEVTTICTQCKRVLLPFNKCSSGISIRRSINYEDEQWAHSDSLPVSQPAKNLSHGLCRTCFNKINTNLLSSASQENKENNNNYNETNINKNNNNDNNNSRKTILSKSLSSPQFSRHLPSRPKRVMIVDDNKLQRQIHKRMIENEGYECDVAVSGNQAIELIQKHSYCFILMDLIMSPLDGWTTSKKIKSSLLQTLGFSSSSPKIIAITGLNIDENLIKKCRDSGMEDVLHKPISTEMLKKVLHKHSTGASMKLDR